jgi:poly-gamma-glutamate capsule biosynthesis protein CapA/YwtB (metallophosphatase superfamily)
MDALDILFTGDLVLDVPDADYWLGGIAPATRAATLTIGHLEVPHTRGESVLQHEAPAPGADPDHLNALQRAGFDAVSLAGNHIADCGERGIEDTRVRLDELGIRYSGAGPNLNAARAPAHLMAGNVRLALLSYNCVGPEDAWASEQRAGCAYLRVDTADGARIMPSSALASLNPASVEQMGEDIRQARGHSDLVVVALHKGILHTRARIAPYERQAARAAIDAGASIVIGHHAHIIKGIEFYRGRPIFHGLGNGCVVTHALAPDQSHPARAAWAKRRRELFGFEPDPAYPLAPFHPDAIHAFLGRVLCYPDGRLEAGFIPVYIEAPGRPVLAGPEFRRQVIDYVAQITREADLPPLTLTDRGDMVLAS